MEKIEARDVNFHYGSFHALKGISMEIPQNKVVAFIGPSGCGKSTFLRLFNRMNDLIPGARLDGEILIDGKNIYGPGVQVDELRKEVGMVFQRPNPFPKSIFDNVAYGLRVNGIRDKAFITHRVEEARMPCAVLVLRSHYRIGQFAEHVNVIIPAGILQREVLQDGRYGRKHPSVATSPELFRTVRFLERNPLAVPVEQMVFLVVQRIRAFLEFGIHVTHIFLLPGNLVEGGIDRCRHEQGIAPGPSLVLAHRVELIQRCIGRMGSHPPCPLHRRSQHSVVAVQTVQGYERLCDTDIVGMVWPVKHPPPVFLPDIHDKTDAVLVLGKHSPLHHAAVEGSVGPVELMMPRRTVVGYLPCCHGIAHFSHGLPVHVR